MKVLIVDDNEDSATTLAELVEIWGHETRVAFNGTSALKEAAAFQPEIILLDIGLPDIDGFKVATRLRGELGLATTRLIALTGYGQEEDLQRTEEAGFERHFVKPVRLEDLQAVLTGGGQ